MTTMLSLFTTGVEVGVGVEVCNDSSVDCGVAKGVGDGDTIGMGVSLGDIVGVAEGIGDMVARRDGIGDTDGDTETRGVIVGD